MIMVIELTRTVDLRNLKEFESRIVGSMLLVWLELWHLAAHYIAGSNLADFESFENSCAPLSYNEEGCFVQKLVA